MKKAAWAALTAVGLAACQPSLLNEAQTPDPTKSGRMGAEWLTDSRVAYGSSMEVETYTYRVVENYGASKSRELDIASNMPSLYREKVESRVLQDGSYEMNTEQLRPQQMDKLPPTLREWQQMGPHRTVVVNNQATFYDQGSKAISQRALKATNYSAQIQEMRETKGIAKNAPLTLTEPTGYPKVDAATLHKALKESVGGAKQLSKYVVQVRQDKPTPESKEYVLTTFDTYHGRVLASEVHDAATNKLLFRSVCRYKGGKDDMKLVGVYSESYLDDAKTGFKAKEIRYQTIQNAQFVNNI